MPPAEENEDQSEQLRNEQSENRQLRDLNEKLSGQNEILLGVLCVVVMFLLAWCTGEFEPGRWDR